jgi:predicted nucleic acid-binding protein
VARIFWDTNLFIYLFEDQGELGERVASLRKASIARGDEILTSALTAGEVLVRPVAAKAHAVERRYLEFFRNPRLTIVPFDLKAATFYARIRQDRTIRPPDGIQLACAAAAGVDLFITNDGRLSRKIVPGVSFITGLREAPL